MSIIDNYKKIEHIKRFYPNIRSYIKTKIYKIFFKIFPKNFKKVLHEACKLRSVSLDYAIKKATVEREEFVTNFESKKRETEEEIFSAYSESDIYIYMLNYGTIGIAAITIL